VSDHSTNNTVSDARTVAIHQPNFLPWLGYFNKIARADRFVLLDNAQMSKTGGTWSNRVQVLVNGGRAWLTIPIVRAYHGVREIREIQIDASKPWRKKALSTIRMSYARAPHFADVFPVIAELLECPASTIVELNLMAIRTLCTRLGLDDRKLLLASDLVADGEATERLISLVKGAGGDTYLAGGGAAGYQEDASFAAAGIDLLYQSFEHPVYSQQGAMPFVPGLSIVDAALNCGWAETANLISR
jgi:WbqC-like protein